MFVKILAAISAFFIAFFSVFGINIKQRGYKLNMEKLDKNISASQKERIENGLLTGSHIIVNQGGENIFNKTYGKKSVDGKDIDGTETYRIASMTKPVTAVALLIEYEKGNIDIYKNLYEYLPEFKNMKVIDKTDENGNVISVKDAKNPVKVYQLVSHTSGLGSGTAADKSLAEFLNTHKEPTISSITEYFSTLPLEFEPGTKQVYNTVAYDIAAKIIENVSGLEYEEYLKKNIFEPLGMTDTTFEPSQEQFERMVAVHGYDESTGKAYDAPSLKDRVFGSYPVCYHAAGAGLMSTAEDYSKFAEMLLNGGTGANGKKILSEEYVKLMATPVPEADDVMSGDTRWGLGVRVITGIGNTLPVGTFGWSGAYGSHFWIDPTNKISAVYMKNSTLGGAGCETANEFEKDVMNSFTIKHLGD